MKTFIAAVMVALASSSAAQTLTIEPAVKINFETKQDVFYQVEMSRDPGADTWTPLGPTRHGNGQILSEAVPTSPLSTQFFRTREFNLTNSLFAHYRFDGGYLDWTGKSPSMNTGFSFTTNRFRVGNSAVRLLWNGYAAAQETALTLQVPAGLTSYTVSFWACNWPGIGPEQLFTLRGSQTLYVIAEDGPLRLAIGSRENVVSTSKPIRWTEEQWYLFQLVCDRTNYKLYLNAELVGEATVTTPAYIIDYGQVAFGPRSGILDEVRLYARALSEAELKALFRLEE